MDEALEIKDEIFKDLQIKSESKKSALRQDGGTYSYTTAHISSSNDSSVRTFIEYDIDETLDIKDEIIQDPETTTGQERNKTYELKLCTVGIREADSLAVINNPGTHKKKKVQKSQLNPEKKHKCKKCARCYASINGLNQHKRLEHATIEPRFTCDFCGYTAKMKSHLAVHIASLHSQTSKTRYHCNKCTRSYNWLNNLFQHKRLEHAAVKPQFICDFCGYKAKVKCHLSKHITSRHSQTSKSRYKCDKCSRSYIRLSSLNRHKLLEHASVKPRFFCDFCGFNTNLKRSLSRHITSRHLQTSKSRYKCDKCSQIYNWSCDLIRHKRSDHAAVEPQFICEYSGYKSNLKNNFVKDIDSRHSETSKSKYKCDKCSRSYSLSCALSRHKRLDHGAVGPEFICEYCGYKSNRKSNLVKHITSRHLQTSKSKYKCDKCSRSYTWLHSLNLHKRVDHAAILPVFVCKYCDYQSNRKNNLVRHIASRHSQASKSKHKCDKCSRSYTHLTTLKRHQRLEHVTVNNDN